MRRSRNVGVALIGLLVVAAISVAAGSGRKPAKEQQTAASLRRISGSEVMDILHKFPEMVPARFASQRSDTGFLKDLFKFSELTAPALSGTFPMARFYQGIDISEMPGSPYLMAIARDQRHMMTGGFNRLLIDNGLKVTDKNVLELAKAFVVTAMASENYSLPENTFLEAKRIKQVISGISYDAWLKVKIGDQVEEWYFDTKYGQFGVVSRGNAKGYIKQYNPVEGTPRRTGQLDDMPSIDIDSGAYVEWQDVTPHYYLIVKENDDSTGNQARFSLSGFEPNAKDVYIRVEDPIRAATRLFHRVEIDGSGRGACRWTPPVESTGICWVGAGYADTTDSFGTYRDTTLPRKELTPERLKTDTFPGSSESLKVYFTDQFFKAHPQGEGHAGAFAQSAMEAMRQSWRMQVDTWGLGTLADTDGTYQVFVNDSINWYHMSPKTTTREGPDGRTAIRFSAFGENYGYTNEDSVVRSLIAHEFYHSIQWGLDSNKWGVDQWAWFGEGQAVFLQSVQCDSEEFSGTEHYYPHEANQYLADILGKYMNASVKVCSAHYCLFWRHLRDTFPDGIQLVRDCYAAQVGTSNSIGRGKAAIDAAIQKWSLGHGGDILPGYPDFLHALDQFAVACYLNDTSFHLWHDPHGVYSRPQLTFGTDTAFRLGPNEADSILVIDSVPHSYGIDLIEVALNGNVDTVLVSLTRPANRTLSARMIKVYQSGSIIRYKVVPAIESLPDSSTFWRQCTLETANKEGICLAITRQDTLDDSCCNYTAGFFVKRSVGVSDLHPVTDTVIAGTVFTPTVVVKNGGWIKQEIPVTFSMRYSPSGTLAYTDTETCTLNAGAESTFTLGPCTVIKGSFVTCCSVYIAHDTIRSDDTVRGTLVVLGDTWQPRPAPNATANDDAALAAVGDTLVYAFLGKGTRGFYCYNTRSREWSQKTSPCALSDTIEVGAALTWDRGTYVYALLGCPWDLRYLHHYKLLRYNIESDTWTVEAYLPRPFGPASDLVWADDRLYALEGGHAGDSAHGFYQYSGSWTRLDDVPGFCYPKTSLCWDQAGHIYALCAAGQDTFCQYTMSTGDWMVMNPFPDSVYSTELVYNSLDSGIYSLSDGGRLNCFRRYDAALDSWSDRADPLGPRTSHPGGLASCAGFVYSLTAKEYDPTFSRYAPIIFPGESRLAALADEPVNSAGLACTRFEISPNPARGAAQVQWQVGEPGPVTLRVFDNAGRVVRTIQNGYQAAGRYSARWDGVCDNGRRAASGIFFYCLDAPGFHKIVKVAAVGR